MKIVHLVRQFYPGIGGLEDAVLNLARDQRDARGLDARVTTLDRLFTAPGVRLAREDEVAGVPVRRVGWWGSRRYPLAPAALRHIGGADVVHVHAIDFFFDALAASRPFLAAGTSLVASTHGGFFHTSAGLAKRAWFSTVTRASASAYDAIVATSHADAATFRKLGHPALETIENGVDLGKFADAARAGPPAPRMISFGRFASHKRLPALFDLLREIRTASGQDWTLVLAGGPGDLPEEALRAATVAAGVADAVQIVPSPDEAALRALISGCSFFACASSHEGFGLAAVEALSAGLVPLLSPIPPFTALLARAGIGASFDPLDARRGAATLLALHDEVAAAPEAARARARRAAAGYGWDGAGAAYLEVYHRALSSRRGAGPRHSAGHTAPDVAAEARP